LRKIFFFSAISIFIIITGCEETQESTDSKELEESEMSEEELYDIYYIFEAPKATEEHDLSKTIKVVFSSYVNSIDSDIAIDIKNNEILIEPWMSSLGVDTVEGTEKINDANKVLEILEKYNVQDWKEDYTYEDPATYEDGVGWLLLLQFEDGTVTEYRGSGTDSKEITPENFEAFVTELNSFVDERLEPQ
jgi:uncharacterized lipoprotein YehR (DUF1307 family)